MKDSLPEEAIQRIRVQEINGSWSEFVGPALAEKSRLVRVDGRNALICASSPSAAQQLRMRGKKLLTLLQTKGGLNISVIKVYLGSTTSSQHKKNLSRTSRKILPTLDEVRQAEEDISGDHLDPEVAHSLASLIATYRKRFGRK